MNANTRYKYDRSNPLLRYYENLKKENKGNKTNSIRVLSELTGLPHSTVISILRMKPDAVERMKVGTWLKIKNTIGVDMLSYGEEKRREITIS